MAGTLFLLMVFAVWPVVLAAIEVGGVQLWPVHLKTEFSPWRVSGDTGYTFTSRMIKDRKPSVDSLSVNNINLSKESAGFVWKPWLLKWHATTTAGINVLQHIIHATPATDNDSDALTRQLGGDFNFGILPESRFPFNAKVSRKFDDSSEGQAGRGSAREEMGLTQDYQNPEGNMRVSFRADHGKDSSGTKNISGFQGISIPAVGKNEATSVSDNLALTISKRFTSQTVDITATNNRNLDQTVDMKNKSNAASLVVVHNYSTSETWNVNTLANLAQDQIQATDGSTASSSQLTSDTLWEQLSSTAFWRSGEKPLSFTLSSRVSQQTTTMANLAGGGFAATANLFGGGNATTANLAGGDNATTANLAGGGNATTANLAGGGNATTANLAGGKSSATGSEVITRLGNLNLGGSYKLTSDINLGGSLSGNVQEAEQGQETKSSADTDQTFQLTYSPENKPLGPFMYNWFASSSATNRVASGKGVKQSLGERAGHGILKELLLEDNSAVNLVLNESFSSAQENQARDSFGVTHSLSTRYSKYHNTGRVYVDLSLTDSHTFELEEVASQLFNTQLSSDGQLWKDVTWRGNLTSQWGRKDEKGTIAYTRSSGVDMVIQRQDLFNLPGLRFSSVLSLNVGSRLVPLGNLIGSAGLAETRNWWNTVDYQLGKMAVRLLAGGTETATREGKFEREGRVMLEARRYFDTSFKSLRPF